MARPLFLNDCASGLIGVLDAQSLKGWGVARGGEADNMPIP